METYMTQNKKEVKVLVCDDDDVFLKFCSRIIKKMGFSVLTAANGDDAIEELAANPDTKLALIDLLMPIRSGWEVIKYVKKHDKLNNIPLVAITGLTPSPQDLIKVKENCNAVIHKGADFNVEELTRIIKDLTMDID
jgi:CheY-like chemotaxis protein